RIDTSALFVNSLLPPTSNLLSTITEKSQHCVISDGRRLVAAYIGASQSQKLLESDLKMQVLKQSKTLSKKEAAGVLLGFPWELMARSKPAIAVQAKSGRFSQSKAKSKGKGRVYSASDVEIESNVTFDTSAGDIILESQTSIQAGSRITGPTSIGQRSMILGARIGPGTVIGSQCKIGGEVEESIFMSNSNKPHGGYIGHSYVGEWVNLGALTTNSDLKDTYGTVRVRLGRKRYDTAMTKFGTLIGDGVKTSIGTYIYTGKRIGPFSQLHGFVTDDVPPFTIYAKSLHATTTEIRKSSAIDTTKRMMGRRGEKLSSVQEKLIGKIFDLTSDERRRASVKIGKFQLP
ncbi:MAG: hypothetical protein ACE5KG_04470, partial [Nitrososphaerales archaeon]